MSPASTPSSTPSHSTASDTAEDGDQASRTTRASQAAPNNQVDHAGRASQDVGSSYDDSSGASRQLTDFLSHKRGPHAISEEASAAVLVYHDEFSRDLIDGAARAARQQRVDVISESHVDTANSQLRVSRAAPRLEILGSLAGGAGLAMFIDFILGNQAGRLSISVMIVLLVAMSGCFGVAWRRR